MRSPGQEKKAIHRLNRQIYQALGEAGIEIPYPRREISVRGEAEDAPAEEFPPRQPEVLDVDGGPDGE